MDVILVDEHDVQVGQMEKIEVHRKALLHRAFSIFIFNDKGELLLQQRAANKYHSAGLWTNTCCSHPQPGEDTLASANKRLYEEMGIHAPLEKTFDFIYKAAFDNGLTEHEYDHVFTGYYEGEIKPNEDEVSDYCFKSMNDIRESMASHPQKYTEWFRIAFPKLEAFMAAEKNN